MNRIARPVCLLAALLLSVTINADELTEIIQKDLVALGYDPGNISGDMTTDTIVAISKFQAENNLDVSGEASPQLAGVIKAKLKARHEPGGQAAMPAASATAPESGAAAPYDDQSALQAAQQACLQERIAQAQASQKKKRGFGRLMRAVTRTAGRIGGDAAQDISRTSRDVYDVNATAADLEQAAEDLGLTENDLEECRNPAM